jgi:hypothetical protein
LPKTPNGLRYPGAPETEPPNGPLQIGDLAADVDSRIVGRFSTLTALRSVIATPVLGMLAYVNTGGLYEFDGVDWVPFQGLRGLTFSSTQYDSGVGSNPAGTVEQRITGDLNMTNRRCLSGRMYYIAWRSVARGLRDGQHADDAEHPGLQDDPGHCLVEAGRDAQHHEPAGNTANSVPDCQVRRLVRGEARRTIYHFALFGVSASGQFHVGEDDRGRFQLLLKEDGASLPGLVTVT